MNKGRKNKTFLIILIFTLIFCFIGGIFYNSVSVKAVYSNYYYTFQDSTGLVTGNDVSNYTNCKLEETLSGNYNATYSFENDNIGTLPEDWTSEGAFLKEDDLAVVVDEYQDHDNVLMIHSSDQLGGIRLRNVIEYHTTGIIELWILITNDDFNKGIFFGCSDIFYVYTSGNDFHIPEPGGFTDFNDKLNVDEWYRFKLGFNLLTFKYQVWFNETYLGEYDFINQRSVLNYFEVGVALARGDHDCYFDAIGYSWDDNYNIGDNYFPNYKYTGDLEVDKFTFAQEGFNDKRDAGDFVNGTDNWYYHNLNGDDPNVTLSTFGSRNKLNFTYSTSAVNRAEFYNNFSITNVKLLELYLDVNLTLPDDHTSIFAMAFGSTMFDDIIMGLAIIRDSGVTYIVRLYANGSFGAPTVINGRIFNYKISILCGSYFLDYSYAINDTWSTKERVFAEKDVTLLDHLFVGFDIEALFCNGNLECIFNEIGVYIDGNSINDNEFSYCVITKSGISSMENIYYLLEGYMDVSLGNEDFDLEDSLVTIFSLASYNGSYFNGGVYSTNTLILSFNSSISFSVLSQYLRMNKNGVYEVTNTYDKETNFSSLSSFYVTNNILTGSFYTNGSGDQGASIRFDISNVEVTDYLMKITGIFSNNDDFDVQLIIKYLDQSSDIIDIDSSTLSTVTLAMVDYKVVEYFEFLIDPLDNETNSIKAGLKSIQLIYTNPVLPVFDGVGIFGLLIAVIFFSVPTVALYGIIEFKFPEKGHVVVLPLMALMSIIMISMNLIPVWLFFIMIISIGAIFLIGRRVDNFGD